MTDQSFPADTNRLRGFTLVETILTVAIGAVLLGALMGVVSQSLQTMDEVEVQQGLVADARFAMQRMTLAISASQQLLVPSPDIPSTGWSEHVRDQTIPASAPESGSTFATAVLAVTLAHSSDLDGDGVADADNDGDGRIDEDWPDDIHNDYASGIVGVDDDGNGSVDEAGSHNDDEYQAGNNEDWVNGLDDDMDGSVDEDPPSDMNLDGCPGWCMADDDGDGAVDEGTAGDDDEDGSNSEDWLDPVVFQLVGDSLVERTPVPWDTTSDSNVDGRDFVQSTIAENVSHFRVERIPPTMGQPVVIDLTLALTDSATGQTVSFSTRTRLGSSL